MTGIESQIYDAFFNEPTFFLKILAFDEVFLYFRRLYFCGQILTALINSSLEREISAT